MTIGQLKELLQRYLTGKATDDDLRVVDGWFSCTEGNEYRLEEKKREEVAARLLPRLRAIIDPEPRAVGRRLLIFSRPFLRVAAMLLLLAGVGTAGYYYRYPIMDAVDPIPKQTVTAGVYDIKTVVLPDNTKAVLNSGSSITYPVRYRGASRDVAMHGEVFFDVHKSAAAPFAVHSDQVDIQVLGTSFVVSDKQTVETTVISVLTGKIEVLHGKQDLGAVTAGSELSYTHNSGQVSLRPSGALRSAAWIHKAFSFNETPLQSVFAALREKFGVRFIIRKRISGTDKLFTGGFSEDDTLKDILAAISLSTGVGCKTIGENTVEIHYP